MAPWFIEKGIGIQHFKRDPSLSEDEIRQVARWADSGAPHGNAADMPPPRVFAGANEWDIGRADFILKTPAMTMKAGICDAISAPAKGSAAQVTWIFVMNGRELLRPPIPAM